MAANLVQQLPADDELTADADPERVLRVRVAGDVGEARLREVVSEALDVDRLADDADADQAASGGRERLFDRVGDAVRQLTDRDQPDAPPVEPVADEGRENPF